MLSFIRLIDYKRVISIVVLGLISGGINFLFLSFINLMIRVILEDGNPSDISYLIYFLFLMLSFVWSRRALSYMIIKFSKQVFWTLRSEVLNSILKASFYQINARKEKIHASLVRDVRVLTDFSLSIINFLSALVMTIGCFVYMGLQSKLLLYLTLGVSIAGALIYWVGVYFNKAKLEYSRKLEDGFMASLLDILSGFKEIHMSPRIGQDIYNRKIRKISDESYQTNTAGFSGFLNVQIIGEVLFYALICSILLYSAYIFDESSGLIVSYVFILLYLLGSINSLVQITPQIVNARISLNR
ncbi:MAG: hypothetical protein WBA74_27865, partial [Cyclobacteriaceae bacterium]